MSGRWREHVLVLAACLAALAAFPLLSPPAAHADHGAGESCYSCHTLDSGEGDEQTSFINKYSRTFPLIKQYDGVPAATYTVSNLGCTYCHNDNGRTTSMKPAITHFQGRTSFHPVGFSFAGAGSETNNEYLSTYGSTTSGELDCVDCHDVVAFGDGRDDPATGPHEGTDGNPNTSLGGATDKYPEHGPSVSPVNNPFMLRSVTVADEYDVFCRICHRSDTAVSVKGVSMQLLAHHDNATTGGRHLHENDSTVLRTADLNGDGVADTSGLATTAQCTVCHDTHYSSNRRLFNDGHEQHKTAGGMVDDEVITSGDCTTVCHYAGDWNNPADGGNYYKHGHGMAQSTYKYKNGKVDGTGTVVTMGYACTACHVGLDPAQKPHANDTSGADYREQYVRKFNLSGTMQTGDTGSAMGNPLVGICLSCHQSYEDHQTVSLGGIGCQDCHDEHAEGSGVGSNVMMIPEKAKKPGYYAAPGKPLAQFVNKPGTETITYDTTKWNTATGPDYAANSTSIIDFFRTGDANGMCDNFECHGTKYTPSPGGLGQWINQAGTSHKGGQQPAGADCNSCHQHNGDENGGWRAQSSCDVCHAANGRSHLSASKNETLHSAHATSYPGYVAGCQVCHPHDGKSQPAGTGVHGTGGVVNFGGSYMTTAFNYAEVFDTEANCNNAANGCHATGGAGRWTNSTLIACADCHGATGKTLHTNGSLTGWPLTSGEHTPHLNNSAYVPGDCSDCHGTNAAQGNHTAHYNGSHDVAYVYTPADGVCTNTCHAVVNGRDWTSSSSLSCQDCHAGAYIGGNWPGPVPPASNNLQRTGLHATGSANMLSQNPHDDSWKATRAAPSDNANCMTCHTSSPSTAHLNGTLASASVVFTTGLTYTSGTCALGGGVGSCHTDGTNRWQRRWSTTAGNATDERCDNCHGMFGATDTWVAGISLRHQSGTADADGAVETNHDVGVGPCYQCHSYGATSTYYSQTLNWNRHNDGSVHLNNSNGFVDEGATVRCDGCHSLAQGNPSGLNDEQFSFQDTLTGSGGISRWGRVYTSGPQGDCDGCHTSSGATHSNTTGGESLVAHDTLHDPVASAYIASCTDCHPSNGAGGHNNGTVQFTGYLSSTLNYLLTGSFGTTAWNCGTVNGCHDSAAGDWSTTTLTNGCIACHYAAAKPLGSGYAPTSGLHFNGTVASGVTQHDDTLGAARCRECHGVSTATTHANGTWQADQAGNTESRFLTRSNMSFADNAPESATCSGTGLPAAGCHRDGGVWSRLWSTAANVNIVANPNPAQAVCNVCHGQYASLANSTGWRAGTSHYRAGADGANENKGVIHTDPAPESCEDCHGYDSAISHENGSIAFSDLGAGYTATYAATPNRWYCLSCHGTQSGEDPGLTSSHTFPDSLAFPNPRITHVNGTSEPTGCSGCHGNQTNDTFWPEVAVAVPAPISVYPKRDGNHSKHVQVIMDRFNVSDLWANNPTGLRTLTTMDQADQIEICIMCHSDNSPSTGHGGHYNSSWNGTDAQKLNALVQPAEVGGFNQHWNKTGADADGALATTQYAANVVTAATSGCSLIDCHNNKSTTITAPNDYRWYGANQSGCVMCHLNVNTDASHVAHLNTSTRASGQAGQMVCANCHDAVTAWGEPGGTPPPAPGHINNTFTVSGGGVAFTYSGYVYPSTNGTCGTNVCHNNGQNGTPDVTSYTWGTVYGGGTNSCLECHGDTTGMTTQAHGAHLNASTLFGRNIGCTDCHGTSAQTASTHANRTVNFLAGGVAFSYSGGVVVGDASNTGVCGTNLCHNNGTSITLATPNVTAYSWNSTQAQCTICHQDGSSMATSAHNEHLRFPSPTCTDCHASQAVATHMNASVNFPAAGVLTYSRGASVAIGGTPNGTCRTAGCHNNGTAVSAAWNTTTLLACDACHYYSATPTASGNTGYVPPLSLPHNNHFDKGKTCAQCHGTMATNTTHIDGTSSTTDAATAGQDEVTIVFTDATAVTDYTWTDTANSCAYLTVNGLGCHATGSPDWDLTFTNCTTYCHSNTTTAAANPTSGLHNNTTYGTARPTVSEVPHHENFSGGCTTCHAIAAVTAHADGSFAVNNTSDADNEHHLNSTYNTVYKESTASCSGGSSDLGATGCHDGAGDQGTWERKWSTEAYLSTNDPTAAVSECGGCHGTAASGWNFGAGAHNTTDANVEHEFDWDNDTNPEVMDAGTHDTCKTCHGVNDSADSHVNYTVGTAFWRGVDGNSFHGDNSLQMNGPTPTTGLGYDQTLWGCANAGACHSIDAGHRLENSNWGVATVNFGGARCDSCHGYPPTGANDGGTNWNLHAAGMEAVKHDSITSGNTTALKGNHNDCGICHGVKANVTMDGFVVQDPTQVMGTYTYNTLVDHRDNSITMNGGDGVNDANYQTSSGGCATAACHANDTAHQIDPVSGTMPTTSPPRFRDIGPGSCVACHGDDTTGAAWPDAVSGNNSTRVAYADDEVGAHVKHVSAIAGSGASVSQKNQTCNRCHPNPGSPRAGTGESGHSFDAAPASVVDVCKDGRADSGTLYFKNVAGADDTDAAYNNSTNVCTNVNCHNNASVDWDNSTAADTLAPVWAYGSGIAASANADKVSATVTWNEAIDAYPNAPVVYDVYVSTSLGSLWSAPAQTDIAALTTPVTGLTGGQTYYFGVRAKDSAPTPNVTTNTDYDTAQTPSGSGSGRVFIAWIPSSTASPNSYSLGADGSTLAKPLATSYSYSTLPAGVGAAGLLKNSTSTAAASNFRVVGVPTAGSWHVIDRFYFKPDNNLDGSFAGDAWYGPNLTAGNIAIRSTSTNDAFQVKLIDYDPTGAQGNGAVIATSGTLAGATAATARGFALTFSEQKLPAGHMLALQVEGRPQAANREFYVYFNDNTTAATAATYFTMPVLVDNVPPAWGTDIATPFPSGITANNTGMSQSINLNWNAATDLWPSHPVLYDVYWNTATGTVYSGGVKASNVSTNYYTASGLTNGTAYYFGVRAKDSVGNVTTNTDVSASATPSVAAGTRYHANTSNFTIGTDGAMDNASTTRTYSSTNFIRGYLQAAQPTGSKALRMNGGFTAGVWHVIDRFYLKPNNGAMESYTGNRWIGPNLTGGSLARRSTATTDTFELALIDYDPNGKVGNGTVIGTSSSTYPGVTTAASVGFGMNFSQHLLQRGHLLVLEVRGQPNAAGDFMEVIVGNGTTAAQSTYFTVPEAAADSAAPTWTSGSQVSVVNPGVRGTLDVSWAAASDPAPPVTYDLYRSTTGGAGHWNATNVVQADTTTRSYRDEGLPDSTLYYYGVRAKDYMPVANVTTNTDTASATTMAAPGSACDTCHVVPPTTGSHLSHANTDFSFGDCDGCHTGAMSYGTGHSNGSVDLFGATGVRTNGTLSVNDGSGERYTDASNNSLNDGTCGSTAGWCHGGASAVTTWGSTAGVACSSCHDAASTEVPTAPTVYSATLHTNATSVTGSSSGCTQCHSGHSGGTVQIPLPPTSWKGVNVRSALGLNFGTGSINLGGTLTTGTTEAQICWSCHYARANLLASSFSEFGANNNAVTGAYAYNYGTLNTWNATSYGGWWSGTTPAQWTSGTFGNANTYERFTYKTGTLMSMHAANFSATGPGNDPVGTIRCSYCHDVHDTGPAPAGRPFLRGNWKGNPFPEDGAPLSGQTYPESRSNTVSAVGYFPRLMPTAGRGDKLGGFQINQNNTTAVSGFTADNMGGLCEKCHGGGNGSWNAGEINTINTFGNSAAAWSGGSLPTSPLNLRNSQSNGHANSVLGGGGASASQASDIFSDYGIRHPGARFYTGNTNGQGAGMPIMAQQQLLSSEVYGFRGYDTNTPETFGIEPNLEAAGIGNTDNQPQTVPNTLFNWGGPLTIQTTVKTIDNKYHRFPCSKCHNPHASRLPRLMITNCLDIKHQTWDTTTKIPTTSPAANINNETVGMYNLGMTWPQSTAAVNCHRVADPAAPGYVAPGISTGNHRGAGWNLVTPW